MDKLIQSGLQADIKIPETHLVIGPDLGGARVAVPPPTLVVPLQVSESALIHEPV